MQAHHAVFGVVHSQVALGALAQVLRCAVVGLMRADPALRGACELFGARRLGLCQQLGVAGDGSRAGSGDRVSQASGVGLRHVTGLHRVTQFRHFLQCCGCGDLVAGFLL